MTLPLTSLLGITYSALELGLALFKRAKPGAARAADRGSLRALWLVIGLSVAAAYILAGSVRSLRFGYGASVTTAGVALFVLGLALRWYSIVYLGRFFTVNVAIAADHRLIDGGPYRFIRHPSYTGALMAFVGLGLCLRNGASLAAIVLPPLLVFLWRIRVEENALSAALGDSYRDYMRRTKRLIPGLY